MRYQDTFHFATHVAQLLASMGTGLLGGSKSLMPAARRKTGSELRNPDCPFQAERIAKAAEKRQRKADALSINWYRSYTSNYTTR